jgi:hypothetical protein
MEQRYYYLYISGEKKFNKRVESWPGQQIGGKRLLLLGAIPGSSAVSCGSV